MKQLNKFSTASLCSAGALALFLAASVSTPASAGDSADPNGCQSTAACGDGEGTPEISYSMTSEDMSGAPSDTTESTGRDGDGESGSDSSDNEVVD